MLTLLMKVALASLALLLVAAAGQQLLLSEWAIQPFWPQVHRACCWSSPAPQRRSSWSRPRSASAKFTTSPRPCAGG